MELSVRTWSELILNTSEELVAQQIQNIFFICSSRKHFDTENARQQFYRKWTEYYYLNCRNDIYIAVAEGNHVAGYLMGSRDSAKAIDYFTDKVPSYLLFREYFTEFPGHLHINCHPEFQGKGAGRKLISAFVESIRKELCGVHIVTSPTDSNVNFYEKMGFTERHMGYINATGVLFMGRKF